MVTDLQLRYDELRRSEKGLRYGTRAVLVKQAGRATGLFSVGKLMGGNPVLPHFM
jgi:hypothetical protein